MYNISLHKQAYTWGPLQLFLICQSVTPEAAYTYVTGTLLFQWSFTIFENFASAKVVYLWHINLYS